MKIKTKKSFLIGGKIVKEGTVMEIQDERLARELIRADKCFAVPESTKASKKETNG
jgi:hypothetical protein